jgi:DNA-binding CsgD family transcriptional regulator
MSNYQDYSVFDEFIETFLPTGFNNVESSHPLMIDLEQMTELNNQYFFVGDLLLGKILFTSKRSIDIIGVDAKEMNPYHNIEATHPDEVHRNTKGWAKLICKANNLLTAKSGCSLLSTNMRLRNPEGVYNETLFQCYLFYGEIPHKTVYLLQVHTNIDWYNKFKQGFHYYSGNDLSLFRFPDEELLKIGNDLTKRELEIIKLIESGLSTEKIAEKLFLSTYTINTHRGNILKKSGKAHISELIYELMEEGKL